MLCVKNCSYDHCKFWVTLIFSGTFFVNFSYIHLINARNFNSSNKFPRTFKWTKIFRIYPSRSKYTSRNDSSSCQSIISFSFRIFCLPSHSSLFSSIYLTKIALSLTRYCVREKFHFCYNCILIIVKMI